MLAEFFGSIGNNLVIEFVPKNDPKVQLMLQQKEDIYYNYSEEQFEKAFSMFFRIEDKRPIAGTGRILYFMKLRWKQVGITDLYFENDLLAGNFTPMEVVLHREPQRSLRGSLWFSTALCVTEGELLKNPIFHEHSSK